MSISTFIMRMPNWMKPAHWYVVGPVFRNFYESPAENFCLGAIFLILAITSMLFINIFVASMLMTSFITGGIALWGITHMIAGVIMVITKERELERNRAARRAKSDQTNSLVKTP